MSPVSPPADFDYEYIFQFDNFSSTPTEQASEDEEYSPPSPSCFNNFDHTFSGRYLNEFAQFFS